MVILWQFDENCKGSDGVPAGIFIGHFDVIDKVLTSTCNASLSGGKFPDKLMLALVIFLQKAGDLTELTNYRPISLLNILS